MGNIKEIQLITVLTLSYYSPDLYATIDSVLEQDYGRIQYILIDDATKGFSEEAVRTHIEMHRGSNIEEYIIIKNVENFGTVRTANIGLRHAKGEYIFTLAGDDIFADPLILSCWVTAFQQSGALVMTAYRNVYDEKMEYYLGKMPTEDQVRKIRCLAPEMLFEEIAKENFIFGCCTAFSCQCFEQHGYYDERYKLIEDHSMILRLLRRGVTIAFFDKIVVYYRGNGVSSAICYNEIYEQDVDLIYQFEIMPYVENKMLIQKTYKKWKTRQRFARDFSKRLKDVEEKPLYVFFLKLWFYAHYPVKSIRGLLANPCKIKKMFRNV